MDSPVVGSRQPIDNLSLEFNSETEKILDKFDMYRDVTTNMFRDAIIFGYLEHLMRMSTPLSELNEAIHMLPKRLKGKMSELAKSREEILQEALHSLDTIITREDLRKVKMNILNINYK